MNESNVKEGNTQSDGDDSSGGDAQVTETCSSGRMSFAQFRALEEADQTKYFTKKNGKRLKLDTKGKTPKVLTCEIRLGL